MKTTFERQKTVFMVQNFNAAVKPECIKCAYYNKLALKYYKCRISGSCPAAPPK